MRRNPDATIMFVLLSVSLRAFNTVGGEDVNVAACTQVSVRMRPDNYLRCLQYYGQCLEYGAGIPYDHRYYDAVRRNIAGSFREFVARRDVLPNVRRLVYDTANLYMQRIGRTVYDHETCTTAVVQRQSSGSDAVSTVNNVLLFLAVCFLRVR